MTIDARGRAATTDLRRATTQRVDPMTMLNDLEERSRSRTRAGLVAVLVTVALLIVGGVVLSRTDNRTSQPPGGGSSPSSSACAGTPGVTCVGASRYRVAMPVPVTVTVPQTFQAELNVGQDPGLGMVEAYQDAPTATGVTIAEDAVPVRNDATWSQDPAAGRTAQSMATWLAHRPFAEPTSVVPTTIGGLTAYQVDLALKPGAALLGRHGTDPAAPTFTNTGGNMGMGRTGGWGGLVRARYTLVDVPGAGVTVIWSWTLGPSALLDGNQAYIDSITFG
jgi:hypothetical protein